MRRSKFLPIAVLAAALLLTPALVSAQSTTTGNQRALPSYEVTINSNVRGADIYINGQLQNVRTPGSVGLRRGTYEVRVEARGYLPWVQSISVTAATSVWAELVRPYATIIHSVPQEYLNRSVRNPMSQIQLFVDGQLRSEARVQIPEGWHEIAIVSGGLRLESEFFLEAGMSYSLELILRLSVLQNIQAPGR